MKNVDVDALKSAKERAENEARKLRGENATLRGQLRVAQKERDEAKIEQTSAVTMTNSLFDQIVRLSLAHKSDGDVSPQAAFQKQAAVWTEFERLRKQWIKERT